MLNTLFFTTWLVFGPPSGNKADQVLAEFELAAAALNNADFPKGIELLKRSIAVASQKPRSLLDDARLGDQLFWARLALAWAYLATDNQTDAVAAMDAVISSAGGRSLPAGFGPDLDRLYAQRLAAFEAADKAKLVVECKVPCEVLVNERRSGEWAGTNETLPLGAYRIWVLAIDGGTEPMHDLVALDSAGETVELVYGSPPVFEYQPPPKPTKLPPFHDRKKNRNTIITGGVLLGLGTLVAAPVAITGAVRLFNGRTSPGFELFWFFSDAYWMLMVGGATAVSLITPGSIILGVGATRERKRRRAQASLPSPLVSPSMLGASWTVHF